MIPRVAASGEAIYRGRIPSDEIERRLETCWRPYHTALSTLVEQTHRTFGGALLVDAHSMPSSASGVGSRDQNHRVDIVLGDNHGEGLRPPASWTAPSAGSAAAGCGCSATSPMREASHPALRPAGPWTAHAADRDQPLSLYG